MSNAFDAPHFTNDEAARKLIESIRWPSGPVCSHCGTIGHAYATKRPGLYRCAEPECRKDFSVTTNTVMERSKIALHKWMMGFYLMCASKKGISAHQLHRSLGITYQSAWFMCHRIREAMKDGGLGSFGGSGTIVEADETYYGNIDAGKVKSKTMTTRGRPFTKRGRTGPSNKRAVVSLVERGGKVRSFHVGVADKPTITKIIEQNIARDSRLHTDESKLYLGADRHFASHETVKHSAGEYVRGDVHTNSAEGFYSIFKRGMKGIYQHCAEKHLHRYLAEFDFRYNHRTKLGIGDIARTYAALRGAEGKRLYYCRPSEASLPV
jgi:transposase-like protein